VWIGDKGQPAKIMPPFRFPRILNNNSSKVHVLSSDMIDESNNLGLKKGIHEPPPDSDVTQCTSSSTASDISERRAASLYFSDDEDDEDDDDDSAAPTKSNADDHSMASPFLYGTQHIGDVDDLSTTPQSHFELLLPPAANPVRTVPLIPTASGRESKKIDSFSHIIYRRSDSFIPDATATATTTTTATMISSAPSSPPSKPSHLSHHSRAQSEIPKMTLDEADSFYTDEEDTDDDDHPFKTNRATTPTSITTNTTPRHRRMGSETTGKRKPFARRDSHRPVFLLSKEGAKPASPAYDSATIASGQSASRTLSHLHSTLQMRLHRHGANHPLVAEVWNRLGNYFFRSRTYQQALECYREAVRCCTSTSSGSSIIIFGGSNGEGTEQERDDEAKETAAASMNQLATAYRSMGATHWATGKSNLAIPFLHKALDVYETHDVFAKHRSKHVFLAVASTWHQLGLALSLQQSYDDALKALWQAKSIREQVLGPRHVEVGRTVDAIGKVFCFQGNFDAALTCHQDALAIKRAAAKKSTSASSTPANSGVVTSLMNLAALHQVRGESSQAIHLYEQVLRMQMAALVQGRSSSGNKSWLLVRAAMEVGETLLLLSDLFDNKSGSQDNPNTVSQHQHQRQAQRMCKEAILVYREVGLEEQHPQMQMAIQRYQRLQQQQMVQQQHMVQEQLLLQHV
jgi:tetratricopeptide (TPR) repeat protein